MLYDAHGHIFMEEGQTPQPESGAGFLTFAVSAGFNLWSSRQAADAAAAYPWCYASAGIHPQYLPKPPRGVPGLATAEEDMASILMAQLEGYARQPKVVAIGEIGLDLRSKDADKKRQKAWFVRQLKLAARLDKPVVVHAVGGWSDTKRILTEEGFLGTGRKVLLHGYSGSAEMARELADGGAYFSFGPQAAREKNKKAARAIEAIPAGRLFIETDATYLADAPAGDVQVVQRMLSETAAFLAAMKQLDTEAFLALSAAQACAFFGIDAAATE